MARAAAIDAGRSPSDIELTCSTPMTLDDVLRRQDLGVDRVLIPAMGRDADDMVRRLETFAADVIGRA
jgi:hypothetical protein